MSFLGLYFKTIIIKLEDPMERLTITQTKLSLLSAQAPTSMTALPTMGAWAIWLLLYYDD